MKTGKWKLSRRQDLKVAYALGYQLFYKLVLNAIILDSELCCVLKVTVHLGCPKQSNKGHLLLAGVPVSFVRGIFPPPTWKNRGKCTLERQQGTHTFHANMHKRCQNHECMFLDCRKGTHTGK